jgi:nicotinate dehydrogenase subunit A
MHIDDRPVRPCNYPASKVAGKNKVTLEGLGKPGRPHPPQWAFIEEQAVQCGYRINGMIMQAKTLLDSDKTPAIQCSPSSTCQKA